MWRLRSLTVLANFLFYNIHNKLAPVPKVHLVKMGNPKLLRLCAATAVPKASKLGSIKVNDDELRKSVKKHGAVDVINEEGGELAQTYRRLRWVKEEDMDRKAFQSEALRPIRPWVMSVDMRNCGQRRIIRF
ncbi:hypothetical protein ONZ45_g13516 [Pleurotus djamor]|nr:hypothetical protein ONZ45_g13516 [Pleurotus djamor]